MTSGPEVVTRALVVGGLACGVAALASAQPASIDVRANAYTTSSQVDPAVAMDGEGNFLVVWASYGQDGDRLGIFGRRFDGTGTPRGPEFQVNSYTTDNQRDPVLAMRSSGAFVVVWQSFLQDGSLHGIFGRLHDATGNAVGPEFQVNANGTNAQRYPSVAMDETGHFVVVWAGYTPGGLWDVWGRQFDASGNALGGDFLVSAYSTESQDHPSVAADGAGNFVVVWQSDHPDCGAPACPSIRSFGRRFDPSGTPRGPDFPVSSTTTQEQGYPQVAVAEDSSFMVVWQDGLPKGVRTLGRVFDAAGVPVGSDIVVDTAPPPDDEDELNFAFHPSVAADQAGNFVVAWRRETYRERLESEYDHHVRTRRFDPLGNPLGPGSPANTSWLFNSAKTSPSVATRTPGAFVVAWATIGDVFARSPDVLFVDAFETAELSAWSSNSTDAGDLSTSHAARMAGSPSPCCSRPGYGLQAVVDDQASLFVQDDTPASEVRYRARFYLDPNGFDPGESVGKFRQHIFLAFTEAPLKRLALIMLRRIGGQYAVGAHVRRDDDTLAKSAFTAISDGPHAIEIDWQKATSPGANDGRFELWIDGTSVVTLTGLDNDQRGVDFVRMGALSVKASAAGTLYFDEFVSRRLAYIGP